VYGSAGAVVLHCLVTTLTIPGNREGVEMSNVSRLNGSGFHRTSGWLWALGTVALLAAFVVWPSVASAKAIPRFNASGTVTCTGSGLHPKVRVAHLANTPLGTVVMHIQTVLSCSGTTGNTGVTVTGGKLTVVSQPYTPVGCANQETGPMYGTIKWITAGGTVQPTFVIWSAPTEASLTTQLTFDLPGAGTTKVTLGSYPGESIALHVDSVALPNGNCYKTVAKGFPITSTLSIAPSAPPPPANYLSSMGIDAYAGLGLGQSFMKNLVAQTTPAPVGTKNTWAHISDGVFDTFAIKADGTLWGWGSNDLGQLGTGKPVPGAGGLVGPEQCTWGSKFACSSIPIQIQLPTAAAALHPNTWAHVSAGYNYTMAINTDGTLWGWGGNEFGQLGTGSLVGPDSETCPDGTGQLIACSTTPYQIGTDTWMQISASNGKTGRGTFGIKTGGTLWGWGDNNQVGQLGTPCGGLQQCATPTQITMDNTWTQVSAGGGWAMAIQSGGKLWGWGSDNNGQLGDGDTSHVLKTTPQQIPGDWAQVSAGPLGHTMAIDVNGGLWAWGDNSLGELGDGSANLETAIPEPIKIPTPVPPSPVHPDTWAHVSAGYEYTIAINTDGTLWGWGDDGTDHHRPRAPMEIFVASATSPNPVDSHWTQVSAGQYDSIFLNSMMAG